MSGGSGATLDRVALRFPAFVWAQLHVPLILLLYIQSILLALNGLPLRIKTALVFLYIIEAAVAAGIAYAVTLPLSFWPRIYRWAAPCGIALMTGVVLLVDSRLYASLNFHINGLFFRVVMQPNMMTEIGLEPLQLGVLMSAWVVYVAVSMWAGAKFIRKFAVRRKVLGWLVLLFALEAADRVAVAYLNFWGGPAVFAAGQTLPYQIRFTMNRVLSRATGRPMIADPLEVAAKTSRAHLPAGVAPDAVHFARRPDIIIALIESTRHDFLDSLTMPNLWRRAQAGALFERFYTAATSTHYSVFSLFYALQSHKLEAVVGTGQPPLLFGALRANGYASRLVAASSVDWMGMRKTVFGAVERDLTTELRGATGQERDASMLAIMRRYVAAADTAQPLFLFLFFDGTHFDYSFPPDAARFSPAWDGRGGSIEAARIAPLELQNRARNSAWEVDRKLEGFISFVERIRGRAPLMFALGDHGEEYREHGRVGHGTAVTEEQIHVPMVITGPGVPAGRVAGITSSVDIVPTLFALVGDTLNPAVYSDGISMFTAAADRFVLTSVGWEPKFAVIGRDLKATFATYDLGMSSVRVLSPNDQPLPDASARFAELAPAILRAFAPGIRPAAGCSATPC